MADLKNVRGRTGLALILTLLLLFASACKSTSDSSSSGSGSGGSAAAVAAPAPASASISASSGDTQKICGTPPCVRFVSRGDTKTLASTIADHPILSTVALHAAVMVLCGGILCLLGEGVTLDYVGHAAKDAADHHECLKVNILSDADKWKLVSLTSSNQSPFCKD